MVNKEIETYLDEEGKVKQYPAKWKKQVLVLSYLAGRIPADRIYSEREFNDLLKTMHTFNDPATLRREMVNLNLVVRDRDGANYRLNADRPGDEELSVKYCGGGR